MGLRLLHHHKSSHGVSAEEDRISNLPDSIVHRIFDFLPFNNVAETCVLSNRWQHLWYSYPCLDFTTVSERYTCRRTQLTYSVDHVVWLLEKHSDVKKLKYHGPFCLFPSSLNRLMKKAVRHNVQILNIVFDSRKSFTLPRCIVDSLSLRDLRLASRFLGPGIALPPLEVMKSGFKSLGSLSLSRVNLRSSEHLNLFAGSCSFPSLTNLCLESCLGLKFLRIQMPGLREFALRYCDELEELDVSIEKLEKLIVYSCFTLETSTRVKIDAPFLESITWSRNVAIEEIDVGMFDSLNEAVVGLSYRNSYENSSSDRKVPSVSNFLTGISRCRRLTVEQALVKILSRFELCAFERLKYLKVQTCLSTDDARGLANLFQSSPSVDTIFISIEHHSGYQNDFWESQVQSLDSFLGRLRFVKVCGFKDETEYGGFNEIKDGGFVKFLLKHVKDLRRLSVSKVGYSIMADIIESRLIFE